MHVLTAGERRGNFARVHRSQEPGGFDILARLPARPPTPRRSALPTHATT
jgi:hypothetical protein